jgi:hypothetical protein
VIVGRNLAPAAPPGGSLTAKVGTSTLTAGVNEIQNLKVTGASSGTYTLRPLHRTSRGRERPIAFNATVGVIQATIAEHDRDRGRRRPGHG